MKLLKNKKIIIGIFVLLVAIAVIITAMTLTNNKETLQKKEEQNNKEEIKTEVNKINKVTTLETADSAKAVKLIKSNIVKITNDVGKGTIVGTGFFHESGYLITNSHIVDIKGTITIEYNDGTEMEATLISNDITSDIAILSTEEQKIPALSFGNTLELDITDELYAIGYPFVLEGEATVTKGILSARRSAGGIEYLQTDMSLSGGNSGGPLINAKAEVFGMTTYATENAKIGMSISSESLEAIIEKLIENKKVSYVEDNRKSNALSTVLKEIGHKDDDIYDEKDLIDKIHGREKEEDNKETKPKLSGVNTLSKLVVEGNKVDFNKWGDTYCINFRRQSVKSINIQAIPTDPKAKVEIKNNGPFEMATQKTVEIIVTAQNGKQKKYYVEVETTKPTLNGLSRISAGTHVEYNPSTKENELKIRLMLEDKDGAMPNDFLGDPFTKVTTDIYVTYLNSESGTTEKRFVKRFTNSNPSYDLNIIGNDIPVSKIRSSLTDSDYIDSNGKLEAELILEIKAYTVEQGEFSTTTTWTISK